MVSKNLDRWVRTAAVGFSLLFLIYIGWAWSANFIRPNVTDYLSFWAAGHLALQGDPAAAYDVGRHREIELAITSMHGVLPFPYPPPFLLFVAPFSALAYHFGFAGWVLATIAVYVIAARPLGPYPYILSHPAVMTNGMLGQTGFLVTGIFVAGSLLLKERPFLAGLILGALIIKPHFALLLPVAVLASRKWPAIWGALVSSSILCLLALAVFGSDAYAASFKITGYYAEMLEASKLPWARLASPFAFLRYFGVDQVPALILHTLLAVGAATLTWIAWARDWEEKVPILAAASMLIAPYTHTYDCLLLVIPMVHLAVQRRMLPAIAVWLLCLIPVTNILQIYYGPNTIAFAAIVSLWALARPNLRTVQP